MKINFQKVKFYTSINHKNFNTVDAREEFADTIYKNAGGIKAHALALKIYNSEGETEYSADEVDMIKQALERFGVPGFIDGLNEQLTENTGG